MKKIINLITVTLLAVNASAQQQPTGVGTGVIPATPFNMTKAWFRGGNNAAGAGATDNIFGTMWNSPIYTQTAGQNRMKLNGDVTYAVGGTGGNRNGFLLLTNNPNIWTGGAGLMDNNFGAFSLLHLVGDDGGALQTYGFRQWMRNGITFSNNFDAGFIGVRKMPNTVGGVDDVSDFVINWSDNVGASNGLRTPDNLVFNFTTGDGTGNDDLLGNNINGREAMRLTSEGQVGIGPRFSNAAQPKSQLHINGENSVPTYMIVTNQSTTGQTFTDGFHFGITGAGIAEVKQRENLDMRFFTNDIQQAVIKNTGLIGFNTNTPNNELEITSRVSTPYGSTGSGLRFTNMKSSNTPMVNPGLGVLSVDANGDVIYVPGGGIANANNGVSVNAGVVQLGVPCNLFGLPNIPGINAAGLTSDRVVPNRDQNLWFASLNTEIGGVGVGGQLSTSTFCNTGNTFEVSANSKNTKYGSAGASGVRLSKLPSTSATVPNGTYGVNSSKVLTVDEDGDVVLTDAIGGTSI